MTNRQVAWCRAPGSRVLPSECTGTEAQTKFTPNPTAEAVGFHIQDRPIVH